MRLYQATTKDLEGVSRLFNEYRMFYGQPSDDMGAVQFIKERLEKHDSIIFAASSENGYAGFVQLYPSFSSVSMKRTWILNDLYVTADARREGVGQALIDEALKLCKRTNAKSVTLQTAPSNKSAQKLYEKNGFLIDDSYLTYSLDF